ncbi:MAG: LD-carboxypeptidase, partial [Deltaproteobacteria bacterium]
AILDSLRGDFPILFGLPSGHGPINMTIPLGVEVELDGEEGLLRFLEAGVL